MFSFWDPGTKVVPPELNSSRPCLHKHCSHMELFVPGRPFIWNFRHISSWDDILSQCKLRTWMKSSRSEVILGRNRVNSNKKMARYQEEFIPGQKLTCKRALSRGCKGTNPLINPWMYSRE